jgi:hypothetical protein
VSDLPDSASPSAKIIDRVMTKALLPFGLKAHLFRPRTDFDHDGEQAWYYDVYYSPDAPKPDGNVVIDAIAESMRQLREIGDYRFLYVRHHYADGDPASDDVTDSKPRRRSVA